MDVDFAFRIVTASGAVKHVRGIAHVIEKIEGRPMFVGALQDVTESMVAEEALNRARSELAHVARVTTLSALTASIAHEVNQPLSGIITNASTCLRMLDADPPDVDGARETARRTIRDGNRASDVITRLRALFSKKEFTLEPLDLNEATREVIALSLSELQRNRVIVQSELADDLPTVTGDRIQLQQVILNLLRNASDAMVDVRRSPAAVADQNRTGGRRSCARDRAGCRRRRRPPEHGQAVRCLLHDEERRHGYRVVRQPLDRRETSRPSVGRAERRALAPHSRFPFPALPDEHPGRGHLCMPRSIVMGKPPLVSVVDDDESVRESLPDLLRQFGFAAQAFSSAEAFLASDVVERDALPAPRRRDARDVGSRTATGTDTPAAGDPDCLHHRAQADEAVASAPARAGGRGVPVQAVQRNSPDRRAQRRASDEVSMATFSSRSSHAAPILSVRRPHCRSIEVRHHAGRHVRSSSSSTTTSRCANRWSC